jgi:hypothetical protein
MVAARACVIRPFALCSLQSGAKIEPAAQQRSTKTRVLIVKHLTKGTRTKLATAKRRREKPASIDEQEERIFRETIKYLLFNHGHLLVPTDMREISVKGFPVWILTITLRYPTGFEGYVGDLLYDGEKFTFLTEQSVMDERVRRIAAEPEGIRQWNEYRASTLRPGKA